jgi:hypothetical protein
MDKQPLTYQQSLKAIQDYFNTRPKMLADYKARNIGVGDIARDVHRRLKDSNSALIHLNDYSVQAFTYIVKEYHGC